MDRQTRLKTTPLLACRDCRYCHPHQNGTAAWRPNVPQFILSSRLHQTWLPLSGGLDGWTAYFPDPSANATPSLICRLLQKGLDCPPYSRHVSFPRHGLSFVLGRPCLSPPHNGASSAWTQSAATDISMQSVHACVILHGTYSAKHKNSGLPHRQHQAEHRRTRGPTR